MITEGLTQPIPYRALEVIFFWQRMGLKDRHVESWSLD